MVSLLRDNQLLLLFAVAAIGYLVGQIKIRGISLGVAAVLFVGIAVGSLDPDLKLDEVFYQLGLVLFVYTVGLSSGPGFFASFRRKGLRDNLFILAILLVAFSLTVVAHLLLRLPPALTAGVFAGSLTNTPALATVLDFIRTYAPPALRDAMLNEPVVSYSVTYPVGVVGTIACIAILQRIWRVNYAREAESQGDLQATGARLTSRTIRVTRPQATHTPIQQLMEQNGWEIVFGRHRHGDQLSLATAETCLDLGDLISVVGTPEDIARVTEKMGEPSDERLELDRTEMDFRRVFVSNRKIAGLRVRDLNLPKQLGAIITRLRRGDVEFLVHDDTTLELGDRVRVVTRRENLDTISAFFGDSYRALSEIDVLTFGLGLALGLLVGILPIPLPGGIVLRLGLAGGPLLVALVLGALGRTGPMVWSMPYSANLTLRQMGLILFLAGIGTRAGYAFLTTIEQGSGIVIFIAGGVITIVTALSTLWIGHRLLKIPMGLLAGILAGLQTQPAVLGFALEQSENDLPNIGYASVYPVALIAKIILAQLLMIVLR